MYSKYLESTTSTTTHALIFSTPYFLLVPLYLLHYLKKLARRMKSIWWLVLCTCGNPSWTLPETISKNCLNKYVTFVGTFSTYSLPSVIFIEKHICSWIITSRKLFPKKHTMLALHTLSSLSLNSFILYFTWSFLTM